MAGAGCWSALALYTGDVLPENRFDQWAKPRRVHARAWVVRLLLDQGIDRESRGDHRGAVASFERLVGIDPVHEEAYARLMRMAALEGQRHIAVRWYGRLVESLRAELDVEPNEELRRLYADTVSGRLTPTVPAVPTGPTAPAGPRQATWTRSRSEPSRPTSPIRPARTSPSPR